jgi:hypothetical protein
MRAAFQAAGVPGYANGGVVGGYSGSVPGLGKWLASEHAATIRAVSQSVAASFAHASASRASSFGAAGPGGGAPSANAALARSMYPGEDFASWNYVAMRESGWNQFARNPSSGAYGIPQALPPSKLPFAGQAAGGSNPAAQISWMEGYMRSRYGGAAGAAAHERAFNWYAGGTAGAAPGWAWVGERGPELAYMRGGERILPAGLSAMAGAGRGYALGTEASRGLSLVSAYGQLGPSGNVLGEMRQFLKVIADYYSGSHRQWRDAMVIRQSRAMESVAGKISAVDAKLAGARQLQQSVRSGLSGYADLSAVTSGHGRSIEGQLRGKLGNLKKFASVLRRLAAAHLPGSLMQQVVALGPDDGTAFGQEILGGGPALMRQLAGTERAINKTELGISRGVASDVYEGKYQPGRHFLRELNKDKAGLEKLFQHLGQELGEEAARWLGVPKGKRPKGFDSGGFLQPGLTLAYNGTGAPEPVGRMAGGNTYIVNVSVSPLSHPRDVGREVVGAIKAFEAGSGKGWRT